MCVCECVVCKYVCIRLWACSMRASLFVRQSRSTAGPDGPGKALWLLNKRLLPPPPPPRWRKDRKREEERMREGEEECHGIIEAGVSEQEEAKKERKTKRLK